MPARSTRKRLPAELEALPRLLAGLPARRQRAELEALPRSVASRAARLQARPRARLARTLQRVPGGSAVVGQPRLSVVVSIRTVPRIARGACYLFVLSSQTHLHHRRLRWGHTRTTHYACVPCPPPARSNYG
jgi:hypothetical protein